jgi:3-oxoadipate enol-lactonase
MIDRNAYFTCAPHAADTHVVPSLHYTVSAATRQGGRAPATVVLLHELGGSVASWHAVTAALATSFTVVCADQRGHGLSEKTRAQYTLDDLADDVKAVLSDAMMRGIVAHAEYAPVWLVGLAAGAAAAAVYAARYPDIAGLILCCPAMEVDSARRDYLETRARRAEAEGMRAIVDASLSRSYPPLLRKRLGPQAFADYYARFLANDPVCYANANRALGDGRAIDALAYIDRPCLMLAGSHDLLRPPAQVQALASGHPNIVYAQLDAGHLASVQAPDALADSIRRFIEADGQPERALDLRHSDTSSPLIADRA